MVNTNTLDTSLTRPIKRGKQGERTVRPKPEKFLKDANFALKFEAVTGDINYGDAKDGVGGQWMGV